MTGISIMIHKFPSVYRIMLSTLRKMIEAFVKLFPSAVKHSDHMSPFFKRVTVISLYSKKGRGL